MWDEFDPTKTESQLQHLSSSSKNDFGPGVIPVHPGGQWGTVQVWSHSFSEEDLLRMLGKAILGAALPAPQC